VTKLESGTNILNDRSMASITSLPSGVSGSSLVLISEQTASSSSTISFTSDIDSTYKEYIFKFMDIHPSGNDVAFQVNFRDGSTAYDATKTSTYFYAQHNEADDSTSLGYYTPNDVAQGTGVQKMNLGLGNGNDESLVGEMHLFDPSNTTFVKHYFGRSQEYYQDNRTVDTYYAGYCNVTAAIDGVQFSFSSGNIDAGTIKLYGVV
jgi:hypothetical protein